MESNFWSIFSPGPVLREVGAHLDIGDIIALSRTCTRLSGVYQELLRCHWNIDLMLQRFFEHPKRFRQQLAKSDALISGDFALEYFDRSAQKATDLDVFVAEGDGLTTLMDHLLVEQGYSVHTKEKPSRVLKHIQQIKLDVNGKTKIVNCSRASQEENGRVRLFVTSKACFPLRAVVESGWTTGLINFLSWDMAYSLFPADTFLRKRSFLLMWLGEIEGVVFSTIEYTGRGLTIEMTLPRSTEDEKKAVKRHRKIDDSLTWRIPFDTYGMEPAKGGELAESDDYIALFPLKTATSTRTLERFMLLGWWPPAGEFVHHWNARYLRQCG